jgi:ABC-type Mn2+/Zn2+ transport system permease subunit
MVMSAALAVAAVWIGLTLSYQVSELPPSTAIIITATAVYAVAALTEPPTRISVPRALRPKDETSADRS